jgi:rhamnosyltransferase
VLVLLATRNGEGWIEAQLTTVLAQRGVDLQATVRDDDSSDGTRDIITRLAQADPRLHLCDDHRATGSAGGNFFQLILAADIGSFDLVAFCDQDDEWHLDKLARAAEQMQTAGADGYSAAVEARWTDGRSRVMRQSPQTRAADYLFEGAGQGCTFVVSAKLFNYVQASLRREHDLIKQIHYHDWTIYALARTSGLTWYTDQQVTMVYQQHGENDTGARDSSHGAKRRLRLIRTGWYRSQVAAITQLVLSVNKCDAQAARWQMLSDLQTGKWSSRCRRLGFVAVRGRRRLLDRCIQMLAVAAGYL